MKIDYELIFQCPVFKMTYRIPNTPYVEFSAISYSNENNEFHRWDGPAILGKDGSLIFAFNGNVVDSVGADNLFGEGEYIKWCKDNNINPEYPTDTEVVIIKLAWA